MDKENIKREINATFDDVSERYDENQFFHISAQRLAEYVPDIKDMKILDLSTGTGNVAIAVAKKHRNSKIEAVDISYGMLQVAKIKSEKEGLKNIVFKHSDGDTLTYDQHTFDVITCGYGLFFYPEMEKTYLSLYRALKKNGRFIFSTFTEDAFNPYAELFQRRIKVDYNIEVPKTTRERLKTVHQIEELASIGNPEKIEVDSFPIRYPIKVEQWWALLNNAGYKGLLNKLSEEQLNIFKQKHLEEIESISKDGLIELYADTLLGIVHK